MHNHAIKMVTGWALMGLLFPVAGFGQIQSGQSGPWSSPATWVGGVVPGSGDHVVISVNHTIALDVAPTIQQLSMSAGSFVGTNTLTVNGAFLWTGGAFGDGSSSGRVEVAGLTTMSGSGTKVLRGRTLVLNGGGTWAQGDLSLSEGGRLLISAGQTFTPTANGLLQVYNFIGGIGYIEVAGAWQQQGTGTVSAAASGTQVRFQQSGGSVALGQGRLLIGNGGSIASPLNADAPGGELQVSGGTLTVGGSGLQLNGGGRLRLTGGTLGGTGNVVCAGDFILSGGTYAVGGALTVQSNLLLSGGTVASSNAPITIAGNLVWTGGSMGDNTVSGRVEVAGTTTLTGTGTKVLRGKTLVLNSGGTWDQGDLSVSEGGRFLVPAGQTFTPTANGLLQAYNFIGGIGYVEVAGTWQQQGTGTFSVAASGTQLRYLQSGGTLSLGQGLLRISNGGTLPSAITSAPEGRLQIAGGSVDLPSANTALTGGGALLISGGTLGGTGTLTWSGDVFLSGGTYGLTGPSTVQGNLTMSGGTVDGGVPSILIDGDLLWSAGTMGNNSVTGTVSVSGLATLAGGEKTLRGKSLVLNGGGQWDAGNITVADSGRLVIPAGQTMQLTVGAPRTINNFVGGIGHVDNEGTWHQQGTGTVFVGQSGTQARFNHRGTLVLEGGQLHLGNSGELASSTTALSPGGVLQISGGTVAMTGSNLVAATGGIFRVAGGTVSGSGRLGVAGGRVEVSGGTYASSGAAVLDADLAISDGVWGASTSLIQVVSNFFWTGGALGNDSGSTGTMTVAGTTLMSGTVEKQIRGRRVEVTGGGLWSTGGMAIGNSGRFVIPTGSVFSINATNSLFIRNFFGGTGRFENQGLLQVAITGAVDIGTSFSSVHFFNAGTLSIAAGEILNRIAGQHSGTMTISNGAGFRVASGTFDFNSSQPDQTGEGSIRISSGTISLTEPTEWARLEFSDGVVQGTAPLVIGDGGLQWSGGSIGGSSASTGLVTVSGPTTLSSTAPKYLRARTLVPNGDAVWQAGELSIAEGGILRVPAGRQMQVQATGNRDINNFIGVAGRVENQGLWINDGAGAVRVGLSGTQVHFINDGELLQQGGSFFSGVLFDNNGMLSGSGQMSFFGTFTQDGVIAPGTSPGQLTITRSSLVLPSSSEVRVELVDGSGPGTGYDQIVFSGNLQLGGTLDINDGGSAPNGLYPVIVCSNGVNCITGQFATVNLPVGADLLYASNSVVVSVTGRAPRVYIVDTATSPTGIAVVAGAGTYNEGDTVQVSAPAEVLIPPLRYTFTNFLRNGAAFGTNAAFEITLNGLDSTNLLFTAQYGTRSILPVITQAFSTPASPVPARSNVTTTFRFDRSMLTNIMPLVEWTADPTNTVRAVITNGVWISNDTFRADALTPTPALLGTNRLFVSLARDTENQEMTRAEALTVVLAPPASISVTPVSTQVFASGQATFAASGGIPPYSFSLSAHPSGGSINPFTGAYVAGAVASVTDEITVTDAWGSNGVATVSVLPDPDPTPDLVVVSVSAPATASPGVPFDVAYVVSNRGAAAASGSRQDYLFASVEGAGGGEVFLATRPGDETLFPGDRLSVTQSVVVGLNGPAGALRLTVAADGNNRIAEENENNNLTTADSATEVPFLLRLIPGIGTVAEGASISLSLSRNGSLASALNVDLLAGLPDQLSAPSSVTIPAGLATVSFAVSGVTDGVVDGPQVIDLLASAAGYPTATSSVTVTDIDVETMTLVLSTNRLVEGEIATGVVTRAFAAATPAAISLSGGSGRLAFPGIVTIPAGSVSTSFPFIALQNTYIETNLSVNLTAAAPGFSPIVAPVHLVDDDTPVVTLSLSAPSIPESAGPQAVIGTATRSMVSTRAANIDLFSSNPGVVQVPAGVTIPAGSASAEFAVLLVDNDDLDGERTITISGSVIGSLSGLTVTSALPASLAVTDDDGPSLQLTAVKTLVGEGLDPATTLTVRRNTGVAGDLTIDLLSINPGELLVPASVTIPDGFEEVSFPVSTVADGVTDGNQPVLVLAEAPGFAPASLAMTVSDSTLPDLFPVFLNAPTNAGTGDRIEVGFRVENRGFALAPAGFIQRLFLSADPVPGGDTLLTQVAFGGDLPAGVGFTQTLPVTLPNTTGSFWLVLTADAVGDVGEVQENNNTLVASRPITIRPDYQVTVQANLDQAAAGTPVVLSGSAVRTGSGAPAPFELVTIHLTLRDTVRLFSTLTDAAGSYSFVFQPLPGEAGVYTVGADHPAVATTPVQDTFTLSGFSARLLANPRLTEGATVTNVIAIENLGPIGIGNLSAQVLLESGGGFSMDLDLASSTLPGDGTTILNAAITAPPDVGGQGTFRIQISSPEANTVTLDVPFVCDLLRSRLQATPASLLAPMLRGEQVVAQFTVTNTGGAATGPLTPLAPPIPWIRVVSSESLPALPPGGTAAISLLLSPPADLPLGDHTGNIVVNGAESPLYVPFTFRALSTLTGDLRVTAANELTFYAEGAPRLTNATVTLSDAFSRERVLQTNFSGSAELLLTGLPEAYYEIVVEASNHTPFTQTFLLVPGTENRIDAFLPRQTVRITWTVDEIEIEDRYAIAVESTFEANLPIPVIVVEPSIFDMADFPGETKQVDVTIYNHGLLAAQNGRFEFQQSSRLAIEPLVKSVGTIPAMSSITVPVIFRKLPQPAPFARSRASDKSSNEDEGDPNCILGGAFKHTVQCGGVDVTYSWNFKTINLNQLPGFKCGSSAQKLAASSPFPAFGGNFGHCNNPPCSLGNPGYDVPIAVEKRTVCDPCVNDTVGGLIANCMPLIPIPFDLNPFEKPETECGDGSGAVSQFINCMKDAHGTLSDQFEEIDGLREDLEELGISDENVNDFSEKTKDGLDRANKVLDVLSCLAPLFDPCPFKGGAGAPVAAAERSAVPRARSVKNLSASALPAYLLPGVDAPPVTSELASFYAAAVDFRKQFLPGLYLLGDPAWLQGGEQLVLTNWVHAFMQTMEEAGEAGAFVSTNERNQLLATSYPVSVDEALVNATIDRWNRSVTNWIEGRLNLEDVLPGESTDVIGYDVYSFLHRQAYEATTNALAKGYLGLQDQYANVYQETLAFFNQPDDGGGVCARIRLRLEQQAVLSRAAFRAVLEVGNNVDVPIENVEVELLIKDADGNDSTSLFQVRAPELASLSAVDGSGIIPAQSTGKATWVIVPTSDAAPTNEAQHFVQGTLSYTQDGIPVTIPLEPSVIRVLPSPKLVVHYFHERDVFSDDPFTDEIEPAVPYSLGILVSNEGFGVARNFSITSGQPKIIDNEKGLLIDFDLFATEVGGQGLSPSLTADFGDLGPGVIAMGRWLFKSSIQGLFIDYDATFEHIDGLGDRRLSLIDRLEIHEMRRVVKAGDAFEDGLVDFFVNDVPDLQDLPDTLWFSNGGTAPVAVRTNGVVSGAISASQLTATLTADLARIIHEAA